MSARVFNPAVMSEFRKGLLGGEGGRSTSSPVRAGPVQRVKRDLFGPVNHAEVEEIVRRELGAQQARDADRWGFDFERGSPRKVGPGTSRWQWQKVQRGEHVALPYLNTVEAAPVTTSSLDTVATHDQPLVAENNQSHITDYMKAKKRPCSTIYKPVAVANEQPPPKQAKTSS